jgi:hypothetical protein
MNSHKVIFSLFLHMPSCMTVTLHTVLEKCGLAFIIRKYSSEFLMLTVTNDSMLKQFFHCSIYIFVCLCCNKFSDLPALFYYVGGSWLTLRNHITVAEI